MSLNRLKLTVRKWEDKNSDPREVLLLLFMILLLFLCLLFVPIVTIITLPTLPHVEGVGRGF